MHGATLDHPYRLLIRRTFEAGYAAQKEGRPVHRLLDAPAALWHLRLVGPRLVWALSFSLRRPCQDEVVLGQLRPKPGFGDVGVVA